MSLPRVLEEELMDSLEEALGYNEMDHGEVNRVFVEDLLAVVEPDGDVLDLGTGTALLPIELCRQCEACRVVAVDFAVQMLEVARYNVEVASLNDRILLDLIDAKRLPYADDSFQIVISNSIVHHIGDPSEVVREAARVTASGGLIFFRDLLRPESQADLDGLVERYVGSEAELARKMFRDSLHAALNLEEIRNEVRAVGGNAADVVASSDRHWTWIWRLP